MAPGLWEKTEQGQVPWHRVGTSCLRIYLPGSVDLAEEAVVAALSREWSHGPEWVGRLD